MIRQKSTYLFLTILISILLVVSYILLEKLYYSDDFCGCNSSCKYFYLSGISKLTGYFILLASYLWIIFSLWKVKNISRWWSIPGVVVLWITLYQNSHIIYTKGICRDEIFESHFYFIHKSAGQFVNPEIFEFDSLSSGKYQGKILGFSTENGQIKLFRTGEKPKLLKTKFLFWKIRENSIINGLQNQISPIKHQTEKYIEFIGGKDMTEKDFIYDFSVNKEIYAIRKLQNKRLLQTKDGTTRFRFNLPE